MNFTSISYSNNEKKAKEPQMPFPKLWKTTFIMGFMKTHSANFPRHVNMGKPGKINAQSRLLTKQEGSDFNIITALTFVLFS